MGQEVYLSGNGSSFLDDRILGYLKSSKPKSIGVASAFVSVAGLRKLEKIVSSCKISTCRIVMGLDNTITHPAAIQRAIDIGWDVRLGVSKKGIFHPKLMIAGSDFDKKNILKDLSFLYVGSSNITTGGFRNNIECGLLLDDKKIPLTAAETFSSLWSSALNATEDSVRNYSAVFADCVRKRTLSELIGLGVNDERSPVKGVLDLNNTPSPECSALNVDFSIAAWAGLQSFTGEYRFQIEFPKNAGRVISRLIGGSVDTSGKVDVYCSEDSSVRKMQYKFYSENGMFRLNIPNETPGVEWARAHRDGIAVVERGLPGGPPISIRFLRPGADATDVANRSVLLGMWGKTPTRAYGWF